MNLRICSYKQRNRYELFQKKERFGAFLQLDIHQSDELSTVLRCFYFDYLIISKSPETKMQQILFRIKTTEKISFYAIKVHAQPCARGISNVYLYINIYTMLVMTTFANNS